MRDDVDGEVFAASMGPRHGVVEDCFLPMVIARGRRTASMGPRHGEPWKTNVYDAVRAMICPCFNGATTGVVED